MSVGQTAGSCLRIDPEFRALIPSLTDDERRQLEENLKGDGCRDPLVVWDGALLDGHNRYEICERLGIGYQVREIELADRTAALVWIIRNQCGRRNLSESQRGILAAKLAHLEKGHNKPDGQICLSQKEAGALFGVSERTVKHGRKVIEQGVPELLAKVEADEIAVSTAAEIATLPEDEQREVLAAEGQNVISKAKAVKRKRAQKRQEARTEQKAKAVKQDHPLAGNKYRLIVGDIEEAAKEIKANSIDAIITDPPYPEEFLPVYEKLCRVAERVLRPGGHLLVMVGQSHLPKLMALMAESKLSYQWMLGYFTPGQSTQVFGRRVKSNWKPVLWFTKGKNDWEHVEDTIRSDMNDKRFHDWGQSVGGMGQIIERFTVKKSTVLDPFVGGGTTGVAAVLSDRLFVGIDIDAACVKQTAERLSAF